MYNFLSLKKKRDEFFVAFLREIFYCVLKFSFRMLNISKYTCINEKLSAYRI